MVPLGKRVCGFLTVAEVVELGIGVAGVHLNPLWLSGVDFRVEVAGLRIDVGPGSLRVLRGLLIDLLGLGALVGHGTTILVVCMDGKSFGKTSSGRPVTDNLIDELVARAEVGYPVGEVAGGGDSDGSALVFCIDTRYTCAMVKAADIYVLAGLLAQRKQWSYRSLAERLRVPHPVVQRALARAKAAHLYSSDRREVHRPHFEEFAIHALRFVAPAQLGPLVPGVPAAWAAEPMASAILSSGKEPPPVWPFAQGRVRGQAIEPLHSAAPEAVEDWPELGELLALLDSLRAGDARVREVAGDLLSERLRSSASIADG